MLAAGSQSGYGGNLYYATSLGGGWTQAYSPAYGVDAISCASSSFCVDGQDNDGYFRYATSPASTSWTLEDQGSSAMKAVYCLSSSFCAMVDATGSVHIATNTSQIESSSWTATNIDGSNTLNGIACTSTTSCIAVDGVGNVLNITVGATGSVTASKNDIDGANSLIAVACTAGSTCVSVDNQGNVFVSTNGGETWTDQYQLSDALTSVACSSASLCLIANATGTVTAIEPSSTGPKNVELPTVAPLAGWSGWLEGQLMSATVGKWTGDEPITYGYQWKRCNSGGEACISIAGATGSTYTATAEDTAHTLRVVITAKNSEGTAVVSSTAGAAIAAQAGPEAHVFNGSGQVVQSYGSSYVTEEGGQIQKAENFAHYFGDPKVTLDAGTFGISKATHVSFESKTKTMNVGALLYSNVAFEGATSGVSTIQVETSLGGYSTALFAGVNPENGNEGGHALSISHIKISANGGLTPDGLIVGPVSGAGLRVEYVTVEGNAGVLLGDSQSLYGGQVHGEAGSRLEFAHNSVLGSGGEGVTIGGSYVDVANNTIESAGGGGISWFSGNYSLHVHNNFVSGPATGIFGDGSPLNGNVVNESIEPTSEEGFNVADEVYENQVVGSCISMSFYREAHSYVYNNSLWNELGDEHCVPQEPFLPGFAGILIKETHDSYFFGNWINKRQGIGIWLDNNGNSPLGTRDNGIGEEPIGGGQEYAPGNEILNARWPMRAEEPKTWQSPWGVSGNYFHNNVAKYNSENCYFEEGEAFTGNVPSSCN